MHPTVLSALLFVTSKVGMNVPDVEQFVAGFIKGLILVDDLDLI